MSYIQTIPEAEAAGKLADLYKRFGNPDGTVDNVLKAHSLNPESLEAHCALYVQSCHRPSPVSRAEREMVGVVVSRLNKCIYCREHHAAGLRQLLPEDRKGLEQTLATGDLITANITPRERAMIGYAIRLTLDPSGVGSGEFEAMRTAGLTDREILDIAQVAAYFAYANRIVLGLGAPLEQGEGPLGEWPAESRE